MEKLHTNGFFKVNKKVNAYADSEGAKVPLQYFELLDKNILKYEDVKNSEDFFTTVHNGQLKLLLSEVQALTELFNYIDLKELKIIIDYAGAAPCTHLIEIENLFSKYIKHYILSDPGFDSFSYEFRTDSACTLKNILKDKITIVSEVHNQKNLYNYININKKECNSKNTVILFISDIRTSNKESNFIKDDMDLQLNIVKNYKEKYPDWNIAYHLKFKLPYEDDKISMQLGDSYKYLDGKLFLQSWARETGTETRLFNFIKPNDNLKFIDYDYVLYEKKLAYFNAIIRHQKFKFEPQINVNDVVVQSRNSINDNVVQSRNLINDVVVQSRNLINDSHIHDNCFDCVHEYIIIKNALDVLKIKEKNMLNNTIKRFHNFKRVSDLNKLPLSKEEFNTLNTLIETYENSENSKLEVEFAFNFNVDNFELLKLDLLNKFKLGEFTKKIEEKSQDTSLKFSKDSPYEKKISVPKPNLSSKDFISNKSLEKITVRKTKVTERKEFNLDETINKQLSKHTNQYLQKTVVYQTDEKEEKGSIFLFGFRSNIRIETQIATDKNKLGISSNEDNFRFKNRISFQNDYFSIDLTKVTSKENDINDIKYEVELELLTPNKFKNIKFELYYQLINIFKFYRSTFMVYQIKQIDSVVNLFNNKNIKKEIKPSGTTSDIINLKDIEWKNLTSRHNFTKILYNVTVKANGKRRFLIIQNIHHKENRGSNIWLFMPDLNIEKERKNHFVSFCGKYKFSKQVDIILDCEMMTKDGKNYLLIFDLVGWHYGEDMQRNMNHTQRISKAKEIVKMLQEANILYFELQIKEFQPLWSGEEFEADEFFRVHKEEVPRLLENFQKQFPDTLLDKTNDGLVYTPDIELYKTLSRDKYTEGNYYVFKWKPISMITFDVSVKLEKFTYIPEVDIKKNQPLELIKYSFTDESIEMIKEFGVSTIYECSLDKENKQFTCNRPRFDKKNPNSEKVFKILKNILRDPITMEDLEGEGLRFSFKHHNEQKRELFITKNSEEVLVDIGAGIGGDLEKFNATVYSKGYKRVFSIEPDNNKKEEFMNRLEKIKKRFEKNKTQNYPNELIKPVFGVSGTEYKKIKEIIEDDHIANNVTTISFMFSLSYFFDTLKNFNSIMILIDSLLKIDGKVIFASLDGDALVTKMCHPFSRVPKITNLIEIKDSRSTIASYELLNNGTLKSIIKESKTAPGGENAPYTKEFVPRISFFINQLMKIGFEIEFLKRLGDEQLLSPAQRKFSELNCACKLVRKRIESYQPFELDPSMLPLRASEKQSLKIDNFYKIGVLNPLSVLSSLLYVVDPNATNLVEQRASEEQFMELSSDFIKILIYKANQEKKNEELQSSILKIKDENETIEQILNEYDKLNYKMMITVFAVLTKINIVVLKQTMEDSFFSFKLFDRKNDVKIQMTKDFEFFGNKSSTDAIFILCTVIGNKTLIFSPIGIFDLYNNWNFYININSIELLVK